MIDRASSFKRDYKREAKGRHRATLDDDLRVVLLALVTDQPLDVKCRDHELSLIKVWLQEKLHSHL